MVQDRKCYMGLKTFIVFGISCVLTIVHFVAPMNGDQVECYDDDFHNWTLPALEYFEENEKSRNFLMVTSSLTCDFAILAMLYQWTMHGKSWRLPIAFTCIYLMKQILIVCFAMRTPERSIWEFPGWYSLTVQYGLSNSTHLVLHVALLTASCLEFYSIRSILFLPTMFIMVSQIVLMLILRGCFMIDIFAAVVFG